MAFTDQNLYCRDCNQEFVFTAGEQEFYESRGLVNAPSRPVRVVGMRRRCLSCHEKTGLCIAVIVTSRRALVAQMTADRAGNPHE